MPWSRSRRTRRPSSTRPSPTGCSPRSSSREGGVATLGAPIARLVGADGATRHADRVRVAAARGRSRGGRRSQLRTRRVRGQRPSRAAPPRPLGVSLAGLERHRPGRPHPQARRASRAGPSAPAPAAAAATLDLKGPTTVVALVDDRRDDRAPHDAVAVGDPVVRRRHAGRHVDDRRSSAGAPPTSSSAVPSVNDFVVKAVALALREYPAFNSSFVDGRERAPWPRERRHRRRHGRRAARARRRRRRPEAARGDRGRDARARGAGAEPGGSRPTS